MSATVSADRLAHAQRLHDDGLPVDEAARLAGISASTAYRRLQRSTAPPPTVRAVAPAPRLRTVAGASWATLARRVVEAGSAVPCVTDPGPWTHPTSSFDVADAIEACGWCPVLATCSSVAEAQRPSGVVQAGRWWSQRGPTSRAPKVLAVS